MFHKVKSYRKEPLEVFFEKKIFLKFSQISQENIYIRAFQL